MDLKLMTQINFIVDSIKQTDERKTAYYSTLAIGGISSLLDSFVVAESSVLRTNFCAEKPAHSQSAKRRAT